MKLVCSLRTILLFSIIYHLSSTNVSAAPSISSITDTGPTPKFNKFEITFQVTTTAQNFQFPYDPTPPNGVDPNHPTYQGVSIDAVFTSPSGQTFQQPAFYYYGYDDGGKKVSWADDGHQVLNYEWYYPNGQNAWKVRFAPNATGSWQYHLRATDASGTTQTTSRSFTVNPSTNHGFIQVSTNDPRYFEFNDGTPFTSPGVEEQLALDDPVSANQARLAPLKQNGIQLIRTWHSGLFGASWPEWEGGRGIYDGYLPRVGMEGFRDPVTGQEQLTIALRPYSDSGWYDSCRFDRQNGSLPVKPNTTYRLQLRYQASCIDGHPQDPSQPYGVIAFVSQPHDWPNTCSPTGNQTVTGFGKNTNGWTTIETTWNSDDLNFAPRIGFGLVNTINDSSCSGINGHTGAKVWVDSISLRENLGFGQYGPETLPEPSMQYDTYFQDREAFHLDKAIEQAQANEVYLKFEIMEKNDAMWFKLNDNGSYVVTGDDNQDGIYGSGWTFNKTRWLQQAYYRYLQARWGYSTAIHSFEAMNEGDPFNTNHWVLTDEMAKYLKCGAFGVPIGSPGSDQHQAGQLCPFNHPNYHLATTSFWHSFPGYSPETGQGIWGSPTYPNIGYADGHAYIATSPASDSQAALMEKDAAFYHLWHSQEWGSWNFPFPVVRGEAGMVPRNGSTDDMYALGIQNDTAGVWYHNYLWSALDSGALYEMYWYYGDHILKPGSYDHRPIALTRQNFLANIPLANGHYLDAAPTISNQNLRVVGQKDAVNDRAHLWVQNLNHTWKNVVDGVAIPSQSGTITLSGFTPNTPLLVERWTFTTNMVTPQITSTSVTTNAQGVLSVSITNLNSDVAIKIGDYSSPPLSPTPGLTYDLDGDADIDFFDFILLILNFNTPGPGNFNLNSLVDIFDFNLLLRQL